jgi:hypothetical protein
MFEGLTRFTKRLVNKATYDPELDKALLAEKQEQMKARQIYRSQLTFAEQIIEKTYLDKRITSVAYTEIKTMIQDSYKWLEVNQEATALEITEKLEKFNNDFSRSIIADKPRQFFLNTFVLFEVTFNLLYSQNKISEGDLSKAKTDIEKEQNFLKKNPNENLEVYQARIDAFIVKYDGQKVLLEKDKETAIQIQQAEVPIVLDSKKLVTKSPGVLTAKDIDTTKKKSELTVENKDVAKSQQINWKELVSDIFKYSTYATLGTLFICLIIFCGTLAANYTIVRPVGLRILFFIFGLLFFYIVGPYFFIQRYILGRELFYNSGAYLLPLYEYDPTKEMKDGFERLVWFPTTNALLRAREEYKQGLEKMIS